jgi:hypothetical protein
VKVRHRGKAVGAPATPPAVASYKVPGPGGTFAGRDGTYAVRLNADGAQPASGQIAALFTVGGRPSRSATTTVQRLIIGQFPPLNQSDQASYTGVLRSTSGAAGDATGWALERLDVAPTLGQFIEVDASAVATDAAAAGGRMVTVTGTATRELRPRRGWIWVFHAASVTPA